MAQALPSGADLTARMSAHIAEIEQCLAGLDAAFSSGDSLLVERQVQALQSSLAASLVAFRQAEQGGQPPLSAALRARLKLAQARVMAQQAAVHRAHATIDRTLSVLLPREEASTYGGLAPSSPAAKALSAYR